MKKISLLGFIIIVIMSLLFFLNTFYKESQVKTMNKEHFIAMDIVPSSISITKSGNTVQKKECYII
ncbi:hypothetical protein [Clostridium cibarium]|uniref:Uncharacterized protein n=1 Tax=Clostridium cibarium TaxID=2762247 RepID=A0ABR8PTI8_9CLOT|nr:hypothetical protein [Clostridium cibarium]MBD7911467.1 hypothetical protein [Clostridium cibarium]